MSNFLTKVALMSGDFSRILENITTMYVKSAMVSYFLGNFWGQLGHFFPSFGRTAVATPVGINYVPKVVF